MADPDDSDLIGHALGVLSSPGGDDAAGQGAKTAPSHDVPDLSGRVIGEFLLRSRLGEGSFGVAYRCEQPLLGREAVVKVLHEKLTAGGSARFRREAQLASLLHHPYAAHVYAFGVEEDDDFAWIAMELVQGDTLGEWLRRRGPMPLEQFVPFFQRVAEVVQAAHDRGIVHRDLKPSNMMVLELAGQLYPKLLDFGIAKLVDESLRLAEGSLTGLEQAPARASASEARPATMRVGPPRLVSPRGDATIRQLTNPCAVLGTPAYMAPEQSGANYPVGPRSDLYSLGIIAYEALTGHRPFRAETAAEYEELHRSAPIPPLGGAFPPALDRLFQRALAKYPENRWGSALEFAAALQVAANLGSSSVNMPQIDGIVRAEWIADAPQPLAESIAALDGARNAHEARERVQEVVRHLLRYLTAVALATWSAAENDDQALLELVRALDRRELTTQERLLLLRLLARPRDGHPIPELGELLTCDPNGDDALAPIPALYAFTEHSGTADSVLTRLRDLIPRLAELLSRIRFLLDYVLVVPVDNAAERWTGLREQPRVAELITAGTMVEGHPMLLDRNGALCVDLWPLVQVSTPPEGGDAEMFLFDGRGRQGAQMIAAPRNLVRDDADAWSWISKLTADVEAKARMREHLRTAAQQWHDRGRSPSLLWRGDALVDLEQWLARSASSIKGIEVEFALASQQQAMEERAARHRHKRRIRIAGVTAAATVAASVVGAFQWRAETRVLRAEQREKIAKAREDSARTSAENEQGRQALLHNEFADAQQHLGEAYRLGERSPATAFMFARAIEPRLAEIARFRALGKLMWSAAFSPDGAQIVTTDDGGAQIWDARTHQRVHAFPGGEANQAAYSPDGRWLAITNEGTVRVWSPTGGSVHELRPSGSAHPHYFQLAMSPDSRNVAAISDTGDPVDVWDLASGALLAELHVETRGFPSIAFSADGRWLGASGGDAVHLFDTRTWTQASAISRNVRGLSFDPTGPRVLTGTTDGDAAVWSLPGGERLHHLREVGEAIERVAFSPTGKLVATASRDGAEQIWDATTGQLHTQLNTIHDRILWIEFDRRGELVLAAGGNGLVVVAEASTGAVATRLTGPEKKLLVAHFDPSSQQVVGASWDGVALLWRATPQYRRWGSPQAAASCRLVGGIEPDRRFIAAGCADGPTRIWDSATDALLAVLPAVTSPAPGFAPPFPAVSPLGDRAAVARGPVVGVYALPGGQKVQDVHHPAAVSAVALGDNGIIVSGAIDGSVRLTRGRGDSIALPPSTTGIDATLQLADGRILVADQRELRVLDHSGLNLAALALPTRIRSLRPSPDGRHLLAIPSYGGTPSSLPVWDLEHYRLVTQLGPNAAIVHTARWSGDQVVTAAADGTSRLWNGVTGELLRTFRLGSLVLTEATIDPTGLFVVIGASDGAVHFFDATTGRPLWTLPAHKSFVTGIHFEADDLITRGFGGDVTRWSLPQPEATIQSCVKSGACGMVNQ